MSFFVSAPVILTAPRENILLTAGRAETKKDINNLSDYQCLTFNLGVFALRKSGAEDN